MQKAMPMTCEVLAAKFREMHNSTSWENIGREYKVSGGLIYRMALQGYEPKDDHVRAALGLPILAPAPVCPVHGVVHTGSCPRVGKRPRWVRDTVGYNDGHMGGGWR